MKLIKDKNKNIKLAQKRLTILFTVRLYTMFMSTSHQDSTLVLVYLIFHPLFFPLGSDLKEICTW